MYRKNIWLLLLVIFLILVQIVIAISDNNPSNNVMNVTINIIETKNISIYYIPVDDITSLEFDRAIINLTKFINNTYPVADDGLILEKAKINIKVNKQATLNETDIISILEEIQDKTSKAGFTYGVGIVKDNWFSSRTIFPSTTGITAGGFAFSVLVQSGQIKTAAHEIGHKVPFYLCEEYDASEWKKQDSDSTLCPNAVNLTNGRSLNSTCLNNSGCPTNTLPPLYSFGNINESTELRNFMGKSDNPNSIESGDNLLFESWVSRDSYKTLLNKLNTSADTDQGKSCLIISAIFNISGFINLKPFYIVSKSLCNFFKSEVGNYSVTTQDSQGLILENISFNVEFNLYSDGGNVTNLTSTFAIFAVPFNGSVKTINFLQNNSLKAQKNKTPNTPILNLTSPIGNELISNKMNITYNASDLDGDTINYAILISSDNGNTFSTLEIDYSNKTLFVNTSSFSDGENYKVKILATDGINTNTTISQNTFEIDNDMRITNLSTLHENKTRKVFFYRNNNTLENNLSNIQEQLGTGDSTIQFTSNHSLAPQEEILVFIEYNYTTTGDKIITATSTSGSLVETESTIINVPDIEVISLVILDSNLTKRIFKFDIKNNLDINLTNINWTFDTKNSNVINNTITSILQPSEQMFVYIDYNFTSAGTYNVNATARNGSLSDSRNLTITV